VVKANRSLCSCSTFRRKFCPDSCASPPSVHGLSCGSITLRKFWPTLEQWEPKSFSSKRVTSWQSLHSLERAKYLYTIKVVIAYNLYAMLLNFSEQIFIFGIGKFTFSQHHLHNAHLRIREQSKVGHHIEIRGRVNDDQRGESQKLRPPWRPNGTTFTKK